MDLTPNLDPDVFAPTGLDVGNWLDAISWVDNSNYAILTAKHHQGFAMWPTQFFVPGHTPYSISQTSWYANNGQPDVVQLFVDGCRQRGLNPCLYFSMWDTTYEARSGTDETTDAISYIAMIKTQLTELLTNYGDIYALWLDGWKWHLGYEEIQFNEIYNFIKAIQPGCVVIDNNHEEPLEHGQIKVYEGSLIPRNNPVYAERAIAIYTNGSNGWFYDPDASVKTSAQIKSDVLNARLNNAAFLFDLAPGTDGIIPENQATLYSQIVVPDFP